ncbi:MAG: Ldh family oxidoreductase [Myxococcota bacterium]
MEHRVNYRELEDFTAKVLQRLNTPEEYAQRTAEILVSADLRAIYSHGVARMPRYVNAIKSGQIIPDASPVIVSGGDSYIHVDGKDGLGQVAGYFGMKETIERAKKSGVCVCAVKNSNHYGIAGYYSMMALKENLIGFSVTNSAPLVVPTFGKDLIIGTNPISLAVPCAEGDLFVLDMATSVIPRGKLEVYDREGKKMPEGWAVDEDGLTTTDPTRVLHNMINRKGGGILPLGGFGELFGGHKGYGLSVFVDVLSGVLSGADFANKVYKAKHPNVGHFFFALNPELFLPLGEFKNRMHELITLLKTSSKAKGENRIYIHGEKENEAEIEQKKKGIKLTEKVFGTLEGLAKEFGVPMIKSL